MPGEVRKQNDPRSGDRRGAAIILAVGWSLAGALYLTAPAPAPEDPEIQEMEHSKKYQRELERIGGKAAVLTAQLDDWLAGLWEGRARAATTAVATALTAAGFVLVRRGAR